MLWSKLAAWKDKWCCDTYPVDWGGGWTVVLGSLCEEVGLRVSKNLQGHLRSGSKGQRLSATAMIFQRWWVSSYCERLRDDPEGFGIPVTPFYVHSGLHLLNIWHLYWLLECVFLIIRFCWEFFRITHFSHIAFATRPCLNLYFWYQHLIPSTSTL